jgi:hypothetical protein
MPPADKSHTTGAERGGDLCGVVQSARPVGAVQPHPAALVPAGRGTVQRPALGANPHLSHVGEVLGGVVRDEPEQAASHASPGFVDLSHAW